MSGFHEGRDRPMQRSGGFSSGPREMHKATCSECGKECEVPFKPTDGRQVFCRECFAKKKRF
jgi:CxxC-x17-CxxC domain-containing protein